MGWILMATLVSFEVLVSHVTGATTVMIANERPLTRVAADVLYKLGCLDIALVTTQIWTGMLSTVWFDAGSCFHSTSQ